MLLGNLFKILTSESKDFIERVWGAVCVKVESVHMRCAVCPTSELIDFHMSTQEVSPTIGIAVFPIDSFLAVTGVGFGGQDLNSSTALSTMACTLASTASFENFGYAIFIL